MKIAPNTYKIVNKLILICESIAIGIVVMLIGTRMIIVSK